MDTVCLKDADHKSADKDIKWNFGAMAFKL